MSNIKQRAGARLMYLLALPVLALLIAAVGTGQARSDVPAAQAGVTELFGKILGTQAFVAISVPKGGVAVKIRVYVCDGRAAAINEWFAGPPPGGTALALKSAGGDSRLQGNLTATRFVGTVTLANGKALKVKATKAVGITGLYILPISKSGALSGTSERGNRASGHFDFATGRFVITIKPVDGPARTIRGTNRSPISPGEFLVILAPNGDIRGAKILVSGETSSATTTGKADILWRWTS
jgi:hypothetical protein